MALFMMVTSLLAACGDNTVTPVPTTTAAATTAAATTKAATTAATIPNRLSKLITYCGRVVWLPITLLL